MPNQTTSFRDPLAAAPATIGEKLSDTAAQVKDKVSDLGRTAADKIDENRGAAASGLEKTASALHHKADARDRRDVGVRIAVDADDVGFESRRQRADRFVETQ